MKHLKFFMTVSFLSLALSEAYADSLFTSGSYEVPVFETHLKSASQFTLKKVLFKQDGANFEIKYMIPTELTGEKNLIEFKGIFTAGQSSGFYENNKMDCLVDQSLLMCKVSFANLKIDQQLAENFMLAKIEGEDLGNRLSVQRSFSTDPVGIIRIKLSPSHLALLP